MSGGIDGVGRRQSDYSADPVQATQAPAAPPDEGLDEAGRAPSAQESQRAWGQLTGDAGAAAWRARLGDASQSVASAQVIREPSLSDRFSSWIGEIGRDVIEAGEALDRSAADVAGTLSRGVEAGLRSAGNAAQVLGGEIAAAPHTLTNLRDGLRDLGRRASDVGDRALRTVEEGARELASGTRRLGEAAAKKAEGALEAAEEAARGIIDSGRKLYDSVVSSLDPLTEVKKLDSEGDTFTIGLGAEAKVELGGSAKGELQCKKTKDGYEVAITGQAAAFFAPELGGKAGGQASLEGKLEVGAGGTLTMKFATAEEAARAIRVAERAALVAGAGAAGGPLLGVATGAAADALIGPSDDDWKFMTSHASSLELKGTAAASIAGTLGIGIGKDAKALGLSGEAGIEESMAVKIEFAKGSEPPKLSVTTEIALKGKAGASFGLKELGMDGLGLKGEVSGEMKVSLERSFTLPRSIDARRLRESPLETIGGIASEVARSEEAKIEVSGKVGASGGLDFPGLPKGIAPAADMSGEIEIKAEISGKPSEVGPKIAAALERRDMAGVLRELDDRAKVSATVSGATSHGIKLAPEITVMGVGGKVSVQYERKDKTELWKYEGKPSETLARLRALGQQAPLPDPSILLANVKGAPARR
jgi:hypothetical protein